jgi:hypothetical protein
MEWHHGQRGDVAVYTNNIIHESVVGQPDRAECMERSSRGSDPESNAKSCVPYSSINRDNPLRCNFSQLVDNWILLFYGRQLTSHN